MELKSYHKVFIITGTILLLGSLLFIAYKQNEISERQNTIEEKIVKQKQFHDSIVRSENEYATQAQLEKFAKDNKINLKTIHDDLSKLRADVKSVNVVSVRSIGQKEINLPSTSIGESNPNPEDLPVCKDGTTCPDPYNYLTKQQILELNEKFNGMKVPIGNVGFSAWNKEPWAIDLKSREYKLGTVVGTNEDGRQYYYNKFTINVDGKDYDLPITTAKTQILYPESKFRWDTFNLFAGFDGGLNINRLQGQVAPNLNLGFLTYGKIKTQPTWSFLQVGVGYSLPNKQTQFIVTPFSYNVGNHLPLISNTYIGPSVYINLKAEFSAMLGLRVKL